MRALAVTVPVMGSTVFSMKAIAPDCLRVVVDDGIDLNLALGHRGTQVGQEDLRHGER